MNRRQRQSRRRILSLLRCMGACDEGYQWVLSRRDLTTLPQVYRASTRSSDCIWLLDKIYGERMILWLLKHIRRHAKAGSYDHQAATLGLAFLRGQISEGEIEVTPYYYLSSGAAQAAIHLSYRLRLVYSGSYKRLMRGLRRSFPPEKLPSVSALLKRFKKKTHALT